MSSGAFVRKGFVTRIVNGALLGAFGTLLFFITRKVPDVHGGMWTITAIGFLLVAGTVTCRLGEPFGLPHLSGYLLAGIAAGPYALRFLDEPTVESLSPVNTLALSL